LRYIVNRFGKSWSVTGKQGYNTTVAMAARFWLLPAAAFGRTGRVPLPTRADQPLEPQSTISVRLWSKCQPSVPEVVSVSHPNPVPSTTTKPGSSDFETIPFSSLKVAPGTRTPGTATTALTINHLALTCVQSKHTH